MLEQHLLNHPLKVVEVYDAKTGSLLQLHDDEAGTDILAMKGPNFLFIVAGPHAGGVTFYPDDRKAFAYDVTDAFDLVINGKAPARVTGPIEAGQVFMQGDDLYACAKRDGGGRWFVRLNAEHRGEVNTSLQSVETVVLGKIGVARVKQDNV